MATTRTFVAMLDGTPMMSCEAVSGEAARVKLTEALDQPGRQQYLLKWAERGKPLVMKINRIVQIWRPYVRDILTQERVPGKFYETERHARKTAMTFSGLDALVAYSPQEGPDAHKAARMAIEDGADRVVIDVLAAPNPGQYIFIVE